MKIPQFLLIKYFTVLFICVRNDQQYALICNTLYSMCCPVVKHNKRHHANPTHRPRNHTLYGIPPVLFVFQVTKKDLRSSLMMAGYGRNM
jgi:hypothetical protein